MLPKDYENKALNITGLKGKYIGMQKVRLVDGYILDMGENVALSVLNADTHYSTKLYNRDSNNNWNLVSTYD